MKVLILAQDLRISGTSEGLVSRSFILGLNKNCPNSTLDLVYLKTHSSHDSLNLLPVNLLKESRINLKPDLLTIWINRFTLRLFNFSFYEWKIIKQFNQQIKALDFSSYDLVFARSSGLNFELIRSLKFLNSLENIIVNLHDPYPLSCHPNEQRKVNKHDEFLIREMRAILIRSRNVICPSKKLAIDLNHIYGIDKIKILPHHYDSSIINLSGQNSKLSKKYEFSIHYHGSLDYGRNIIGLLTAYLKLLHRKPLFAEKTELIFRLKSNKIFELRDLYKSPNIKILEGVDLCTSIYEQKELSDLNIILDNGPNYSNILVGKAPVLSYLGKPVFIISPNDSELSDLVQDKDMIANANDLTDIENKLESLIEKLMGKLKYKDAFGDYFSQIEFNKRLNQLLKNTD